LDYEVFGTIGGQLGCLTKLRHNAWEKGPLHVIGLVRGQKKLLNNGFLMFVY